MIGRNHSFKVEAVHGERIKIRPEARCHVFEYIEVHCSRKRPCLGLGNLGSDAYEVKKAA